MKEQNFGWFPHPKSGRLLFCNSIIADVYETVYPGKSRPETVQKSFQKKANREWLITKGYDSLKQSSDFLK